MYTNNMTNVLLKLVLKLNFDRKCTYDYICIFNEERMCSNYDIHVNVCFEVT